MTKIALITGASSGFGQKMAEDLLAQNWTVIATFRQASNRPERFVEERKNYPQNLFIHSLDLTQSDDIKAIVAYVQDRHQGQLDLLINNAGFGTYGALEDLSEDQIRQQMETNFFGPTFLTRRLLPLLRQSQGRVITITSIMGRYSMPLVSMYSASKYALEGLHEGLYFELKNQGVQVCTVQPGGFRTHFLNALVWGANSQNTDSAYYQMGQNFQAFMKQLTSRDKAPGPEIVSQAVMKLLKAKKLPRTVVVGKDAKALAALKRAPWRVYQVAISAMSRKIFKV